MKDTSRISKLLSDLYNGNPWIDVTVTDTLKKITAQQAAKKNPDINSTWEIVNHLIEWRLLILQRVQKQRAPSPADNFFHPVTDTSDKAWKDTLQRLEDSQQQWMQLLENFDEKEFDTLYSPNNLNYYEHILGILQHDAYHLGQIVLLAKQL